MMKIDAKDIEDYEDSIEGAKRWLVEIDYKTDNGTVTVDYHVEELLHLATIVERGVDWHTIEQIRVVLNPERRLYDVTVEACR
jgi:hypothetical protein